jgi:Flp pilus assembly protein TadB
MQIPAMLIAGGWLLMTALPLLSASRGARSASRKAADWKDLLLAEPAERLILERAIRLAPVQSLLAAVHADLQRISGREVPFAVSRRLLARAIGSGAAAAGLTAIVALLADAADVLPVGLLVAALLPVSQIRSLRRQVEERRRAVLRELPELLSVLMLLVGAGESLQNALLRCAREGEDGHPLYRELKRAMHAVQNGESFQLAMDGFARRVGVQEASVLTSALLLQYRKGGSDFVHALRELSFSLWEKRKSIARTKGEEAVSKLSLPLVLIFFVLMVIIGSPAILGFG